MSKVLLTYAEVVKADCEHWIESQETACILMNNIQQCRVQLEKVYEAMGGDSLPDDTKDVMEDLQQMLNDKIDDMAQKYSVALRPQILTHIKEVNKLLHQVGSIYIYLYISKLVNNFFVCLNCFSRLITS